MKKLTRDRVVPIISASVSWLTFGDDRLGPAFLAEIGQEKKRPRQTLLARIEELIDQILFDPDRARQEMGKEHLGENRLVVERADDCAPSRSA